MFVDITIFTQFSLAQSYSRPPTYPTSSRNPFTPPAIGLQLLLSFLMISITHFIPSVRSSSSHLNNLMEISSRITSCLAKSRCAMSAVCEGLSFLACFACSASWIVSDTRDPIYCSCGFEKLGRCCCPHRVATSEAAGNALVEAWLKTLGARVL